VKNTLKGFWTCFCMVALTSAAFAQKVEVGYDKSADFSKYKTYSWAEPAMPPTRPILYATVMSSIDGDLSSKGYSRVGKDGDLTLIPAGGIGFAIVVSGGAPLSPTFMGPAPSINATVWTGAQGGGELMPAVPDGTLVLEFVDRAANRVIWSGTVSQKLDIEKKNKSLELASKAVAKLLKQFPPKAKN
jgi:Domain of unknown function (DUF4136)